MKKHFTIQCCVALFMFTLCLSHTQSVSGQIISTYAGNGTTGYSGDGGAATSAELRTPTGIALDGGGNLYIADYINHRLRVVTPAGIINTYAGNGTYGSSGDGAAATLAELSTVVGVAADADGNIYIVDQGNQSIRKVNSSGIISTFAGNGTLGYSGDGGAATAAELGNPYGVCVDGSGNVYIADANNNVIRKVNSSGIISTVAGNNTSGFSGDGGPATAAELHYPTGVVLDPAGNMYIADEYNSRIRKVNTSGIISTIAGVATPGFSGDGGPATAAQLYDAWGIGLDASGNIYIGDGGNQCVRKINTSGIISTIAGIGTSGGYSGDGGPATAAKVQDPGGVVVDAAGNIYIDDYANSRIRLITPSDHAPFFTNGVAQVIDMCGGTGAYHIDSQMTINDADAGQTETWAVVVPPSHGSLAGFSTTATSTGSAIIPTGLSYTPATGFYGTDSFAIGISDGTMTAMTFVVVNVGGTPVPGTITGIDSVCIGDTITLSDTLSGGTWSIGNSSIATITLSGKVVGITAGSDTVYYTGSNACGTDYTYIVIKVRTSAACHLGVGEQALSALNTMSVFPNPNQGMLTINITTGAPQDAAVTITDVLGKKVNEFTLTTNREHELRLDCPAGIYFITAMVNGIHLAEKIALTR